jgi:RNA polymerase sigma factor (sigma-70 family)
MLCVPNNNRYRSSRFQNSADEELVLFYAAGNDAAFEELLWRYSEWICRAFLHDTTETYRTTADDAKDFAQDFFISLAPELKKEHDFAKGMFEHWVKKCCKNDIIDWIRKRHDDLPLPLDEETAEVPFNDSLQQTDLWTTLGFELHKLPQKERLIFILRYFKKLKFRQIADWLRTHKKDETKVNDLTREYGRILIKLKRSSLRFFL